MLMTSTLCVPEKLKHEAETLSFNFMTFAGGRKWVMCISYHCISAYFEGGTLEDFNLAALSELQVRDRIGRIRWKGPPR